MEQKVEKSSITLWLIDDVKDVIWKAIILVILYAVFKLGDILLLTSPGLISIYKIYMGYSILRFIVDIIVTFLTYKNTRYFYNEEEIFLKKGGLTVSETYIPLKRVQHLEVTQTFFSRMFKLAEVEFYTAGDNHTLQYLQKEKAMDLKNYIIERVQQKESVYDSAENDKGDTENECNG